jgi:hypothetical protein
MLGNGNMKLYILSILKSTLFDTVERNLDFAATDKVVNINKFTISEFPPQRALVPHTNPKVYIMYWTM